MAKTGTLLSVAILLTLSASAAAQTFTTITKAGDTIPGVGNVVAVAGLAVDDSGHVLVHVGTDNPNQDANAVIIDETGAIVASEGDSVSLPPGAIIQNFNGGVFELSGSGTPVFLPFLSGVSADRGIYYGTGFTLAILRGQISTAPEVTSGSAYSILLWPRINNSAQLCFHTVFDDPGIAGLFNVDALMKVDTTSGAETAFVKEGDTLPGHAFPILSFDWDAHGMAFNNAGQVMYGVGTAADANVNRLLYIDNTKIAQKSDPSPFGSTYLNLATSTLALHLNNSGDYVFSCLLNDILAEYGIVINGGAFVQANDSLPAIAPWKLEHIGQPLFIGDDGRVLWSGTWLMTGAVQGRGLFVDYNLLVEQGVTQINGQVVEELTTLDRSFTMSPNGQYVLFEAKLANIGEGAFLVNLWQ